MLARILVLLVAQVLMLAALLAGQANATPMTSALDTSGDLVEDVAFTQPLTASRSAAPAPVREGSMSCAGHTRLERDDADNADDAAGFSLNVVVGPGGQGFTGAGPGPLVVTCGQTGRLIILACAPLDHRGGRASAWDRGRAGRTGWDSAGWDQPGWRGAWRADWRGRGFGGLSDEQLRLLNQLDPDQLRGLLAQRYATTYSSGYPGGGYGAGLGLSVGPMRISVGAPIALNQLPAASGWGTPWTTTPGYGSSYGPGYGSTYGGYGSPYVDPYSSTYGNGYGYGPSYGPSSWAGPTDPDAPVLLSSHHHSDDHDSSDNSDDHDSDDQSGDRDWNGRGVGVCRWIGQR